MELMTDFNLYDHNVLQARASTNQVSKEVQEGATE